MLLNNKNSKVGILGFGEIGKAIAKFYRNPKIKDLVRNDGLIGVEVLHICIPWSDKFISIVAKEIKDIKPKFTIINSTISPGTTKKLISILPKSLGMIVHSPVRGVHPNLYKGIKTFVKYVGAENKMAAKLAESHFKKLGIKTNILYPASTTEIGKILDTTYYGVCIAWHGEMKKICNKLGVKFEDAVTDFNKTYNEGYAKLGKKNVIRPVLFAPEGKIGGHCVVPNAKILKKHFKSKAIDLILNFK